MHAPPPAQVTRSIGDWDAVRRTLLYTAHPDPELRTLTLTTT